MPRRCSDGADAPCRMYYLGRSADGSQQGIGVAESVDEAWQGWQRVRQSSVIVISHQSSVISQWHAACSQSQYMYA